MQVRKRKEKNTHQEKEPLLPMVTAERARNGHGQNGHDRSVRVRETIQTALTSNHWIMNVPVMKGSTVPSLNVTWAVTV